MTSLPIHKSIEDQTMYEKIKISWTLEISTINIYHWDVGNFPVLFWIYGAMFPFKVPHGGVNINKNRKFGCESQKMNSWKYLLFLGALFYLLWFTKITNSNFKNILRGSKVVKMTFLRDLSSLISNSKIKRGRLRFECDIQQKDPQKRKNVHFCWQYSVKYLVK